MAYTRQQILFEYWANEQSLAAVRCASNAVPEALSALSHSVAMSQLWASRAEGHVKTVVPWPTLDAAQIGRELVLLRDRWLLLISGTALNQEIHYTNGKGEPCSNRFEDILSEVLLHSAHHRGQVALALRLRGFEPPLTTDYIPALRSGLLCARDQS